jgi:ring-1,2-phenylacetyl-CoA epoxidase subunit PaaC
VAGIAAKALKEAEYHYRFSHGWMLRMAGGTEESRERAQAALDHLWRFTGEIFDGSAASYREGWDGLVDDMLGETGLAKSEDPYQKTGGRVGYHTEHLGYLLTEMQWMQRTYPGLEW